MWNWIRDIFGTNMGKIIQGQGPFHWNAQVDGNDVLLLNVWATAFGGSIDAGDNGITACGLNTKTHPFFMGVSLPMDGYGVRSLRGSPVPKMPFGVRFTGHDPVDKPEGAHVIVQDIATGKNSPLLPVVELGPSGYTGNAIDLLVPVAKLFDPNATSNNFKKRVNVRILGAAKYLS